MPACSRTWDPFYTAAKLAALHVRCSPTRRRRCSTSRCRASTSSSSAASTCRPRPGPTSTSCSAPTSRRSPRRPAAACGSSTAVRLGHRRHLPRLPQDPLGRRGAAAAPHAARGAYVGRKSLTRPRRDHRQRDRILQNLKDETILRDFGGPDRPAGRRRAHLQRHGSGAAARRDEVHLHHGRAAAGAAGQPRRSPLRGRRTCSTRPPLRSPEHGHQDPSIDNLNARNNTKVFIVVDGQRVGRVQSFREDITNNVQVLDELGRDVRGRAQEGHHPLHVLDRPVLHPQRRLPDLKLGKVFALRCGHRGLNATAPAATAPRCSSSSPVHDPVDQLRLHERAPPRSARTPAS
jgi:hypothetical protein